MKLQIKEFAALVGVSVRTLHYYDEIGLLAPASVDAQSGYRYYDDASLARMQEILFYRELDFPLKEIAALLASPNYDKSLALAAQKELLILTTPKRSPNACRITSVQTITPAQARSSPAWARCTPPTRASAPASIATPLAPLIL